MNASRSLWSASVFPRSKLATGFGWTPATRSGVNNARFYASSQPLRAIAAHVPMCVSPIDFCSYGAPQIRTLAGTHRLLSSLPNEGNGSGLTSQSTDSALDHEKIPGAKHGGAKLAIMYTCTVCDTRSAKVFTKQAYEKGVVIVRCPGCDNQHLIADRLGWFEDESWDVERLMKERGEGMVKLEHDGTLEFFGENEAN